LEFGKNLNLSFSHSTERAVVMAQMP